jgi:hypothetical protein
MPLLPAGRFLNLQVDASLCASEPICRERVFCCPVDAVSLIKLYLGGGPPVPRR